MTSAALGYDDDYNAALTKAVAKFMEEPSAPEPLCRLDTIMTENEDPSQRNPERVIAKIRAKMQKNSFPHSKTPKVGKSPGTSPGAIKNQREWHGSKNRKTVGI